MGYSGLYARVFHVNVNYMKVGRGRTLALDLILGSPAESYFVAAVCP